MNLPDRVFRPKTGWFPTHPVCLLNIHVHNEHLWRTVKKWLSSETGIRGVREMCIRDSTLGFQNSAELNGRIHDRSTIQTKPFLPSIAVS